MKQTIPDLRKLGLLLMRKDLATIAEPAQAAAKVLGLELRTFVIDDTADYARSRRLPPGAADWRSEMAAS